MHSSLQLPLLLLGLPLISANPVPNNPGPINLQDLTAPRNQVLNPVERRAAGDTSNELGGACKMVTILFARGTTESGNMGTLVGPQFVDGVKAEMGAGNVAVQGIDYPANIAGFMAGGDAKGSALMASSVNKALTACPDTKVVMAGYSQGGQLVHNAATMLSPADMAKVNSAVIFGDPMNGKAVGSLPAAKTKVICHQGDNICDGGSQIRQAHLTYGRQNAGEAAKFVATAAKA